MTEVKRVGSVSDQTSVMDVAAYILHATGPVNATKLQKLVYYSQAWSLVWDERPMFKESIEAWANGPVSPRLYAAHRLQYVVHEIPAGRPDRLDQDARETVDAVIDHYGDKDGAWLSALTHSEPPWVDARNGLAPGERSNHVISHASMAEYYESLL